MEPGIKGRTETRVTQELTAKAVGSGELSVLATPMLIAMVEEAAWSSVAPLLEAGQGTVGTRVDIEHTAPTPVGMRAWCETELVELDRRRLVFSVSVYDEAGPIAHGTHERFIVDNEGFQAKADAKAAQS